MKILKILVKQGLLYILYHIMNRDYNFIYLIKYYEKFRWLT